jgi:U11-48K-like CHHC zinc finger
VQCGELFTNQRVQPLTPLHPSSTSGSCPTTTSLVRYHPLVIIMSSERLKCDQGPQKWVTCPYNDTHTTPKSRMQWHLLRCPDREKRSHLFKQCPYNFLHIISKPEYDAHLRKCPSRSAFAEDQYSPEEDKAITMDIKAYLRSQRGAAASAPKPAASTHVWSAEGRALQCRESSREFEREFERAIRASALSPLTIFTFGLLDSLGTPSDSPHNFTGTTQAYVCCVLVFLVVYAPRGLPTWPCAALHTLLSLVLSTASAQTHASHSLCFAV